MLPVLQDLLRFYLFGLIVHTFILIPYVIKAPRYHQTASDVVLRILNFLVHAAPPGLVTIMVCNGIIARFRLGKEGLTLMFPECLRLGADLSLVCVDKTGTLTHRSVSIYAVYSMCAVAINSHWTCSGAFSSLVVSLLFTV